MACTPHSSAMAHLEEAVGALWKDAKRGRVLLVQPPPEDAYLLEGVLSSPFARVPKMNPDRTVSSSGRLIWDGRGPNMGSVKEDFPPALLPRHQELAKVLVWMRLWYPKLPILLSKKDVSEAYKWVWLAPEDVWLFAADIPVATFSQEGQTPMKGVATATSAVTTTVAQTIKDAGQQQRRRPSR